MKVKVDMSRRSTWGIWYLRAARPAPLTGTNGVITSTEPLQLVTRAGLAQKPQAGPSRAQKAGPKHKLA
jgi:hypothetical protein